MRSVVSFIDVIQYLIIRQGDLGGEQIGFVFHPVVRHVEYIKFLKLCRVFSVQYIVADFM